MSNQASTVGLCTEIHKEQPYDTPGLKEAIISSQSAKRLETDINGLTL